MIEPVAPTSHALTWYDLRTTWGPLLTKESIHRNEASLVESARAVADALDELRLDVADPARALLYVLNLAGVWRVRDDFGLTGVGSFESHLIGVREFHGQLHCCIGLMDRQHRPEQCGDRPFYPGAMSRSDFEWLDLSSATVSMMLCQALHRARLSVRLVQGRALTEAAAHADSERIDDLAHSAFVFTLLGWRTQRALRIHTEKLPLDDERRENLATNRKWELLWLSYAAQAAEECGYRAASGAIGAKLLNQIVREYSEYEKLPEWVQEVADACCETVKGLGYEVPRELRDDGKFSTMKEYFERRKRAKQSRRGSSTRATNPVDAPTVLPIEPAVPPPSRLYRIYRDVSQSVFADLAKATGAWFDENKIPLVFLRCLVPQRTTALPASDKQTFFDACVKLDQLRFAFNLLETRSDWTPNGESLTDLAYHLIVAQRLLPGAIRDAKQKDWLSWLCDAWGSAETDRDQELLVHQAVLGRMTSLAMGSGNSGPDSGLVSDEKGDGLEDANQFRPLVKIDQFQYIRKHATAKELLAPSIIMSLAPRGISFHAYTFGSNGVSKRGTVDVIDRKACCSAAELLPPYLCRHLLMDKTLWNTPELIPLRDFGRCLLDFVRSVVPRCQYLMLAIEPDLANLPWNVLLGALSGGNAPIVSLIPSLSWLGDHERLSSVFDAGQPKPLFQAEELDSLAVDYPGERVEFERLRVSAQALTVALSPKCNAIVGHGSPDQDSKMTMVCGPNGLIQQGEWSVLLSAPIVLIGSCYGGMTGNRLIADLAGLPGLGLAIGARCVLAPSTELRPGDLADLCDVLADPTVGKTLFHRLKSAFDKFPATRQVAVFGDPLIVL